MGVCDGELMYFAHVFLCWLHFILIQYICIIIFCVMM